jgi:beta-1,4-N-acetylglucosaminyltransferase
MIFVTVGNTAFDSLIKSTDAIKGDVIIQKANGKYIPKNHKFFDYGDLEEYFDKSDIVITHGGAGNIFRVLSKGKKVVAISNEERSDKHQSDLLSKLSSERYILWCRNIKNLQKEIDKVKKTPLRRYSCPRSTIHEKIKETLI